MELWKGLGRTSSPGNEQRSELPSEYHWLEWSLSVDCQYVETAGRNVVVNAVISDRDADDSYRLPGKAQLLPRTRIHAAL